MSFDIEHQVVPRDETGAPDSSSGQRADEALVSSPDQISYEFSWHWSVFSYVVLGLAILIPIGTFVTIVFFLVRVAKIGGFLAVLVAMPALIVALVAIVIAILVAGVAIVVAVLVAAVAIVVAFVLGLPVLIPLGLIVLFSLPKKATMRLTRDDSPLKEDELTEGIAAAYDRARWKEPMWDRIMIGSLRVAARVSMGALIWLALSLLVPRLTAVALLGSPMWKWSLLGATLTAGYFQVLTLILPVLLWPKSDATSYYLNALLLSISRVAYMGMVLGTWVAYFRTHHGLNHHHHHHHHHAFEYATWSIVSFFVGSILMLFKNLLLLKWGADAIHRRFRPRVLITSLKFYFIGLLAAGFDETAILDDLNLVNQYGKLDDTPHTNSKRLTAVSKYVMSRKMSLSHLIYLSHILISLAQSMSPLLEEGDNEEVVTWFKQQIKNDTSHTCTPAGLLELFASPDVTEEPSELPMRSNPTGESEQPDQLETGEAEPPADPKKRVVIPGARNRYITGTWNTTNLAIQNIFTPGAWKRFTSKQKPEEENEKTQLKNKILLNVLWRLVSEECSSHAFTFDDLKIWMVDAHKDCINMGRTLADAEAIVTRLDIFVSFVIFVIVLLLWLLITGVSSTTVLVTVATPFVALTFIFGDSAKIFFQGFIFYFATHPFDVGDRCILDGVELEVRSISILTTTFIKIGSKEKRMYPNSTLATEAIVNLGWQPDPKDVVELPLSASTNLDDLKIRINKFFVEESKRYGPTYNMVISEFGENIKVKIQFTHILTVHDLSHSRCFQKKSSQRSDFLSMIKKHVNKSQIEQMDVKNLSQSSASTSAQKRRIFRINQRR